MDRVCPRDFTLLSAQKWGAATYLYCSTCRGVMLERPNVEKIVQAGTQPRIERPEEEPVFEDGTAQCSCSEARMKSVSRDGVTVDVCPKCKAVWFDAGELERVVAANRRKLVATLPGASSSTLSAPGLLADAVMVILKAVGALVFEIW